MLHSNAFDAALSLIDNRKWKKHGAKVRVLLNVKINTIGYRQPAAELGYRKVAEDTGLSTRYPKKILAELVAERVLVVALESAGSRGTTYAINPDLTRWEVPWSVPRAEVLALVTTLHQEGGVTPKPWFAPHYGASQTNFATRHRAALNGTTAAPSRGANGRSAPRDGASQTSRARSAPLSLEVLRTSPEEEARAQAVIGAVEDRSRGPLFGRPAEDLRTAIRDLDASQVEELRRRIAEYVGPEGPPIVAGWAARLAGRLRAGEEPGRVNGNGAPEEPEPAWLPAEWVPEAGERPPDAAERARAVRALVSLGAEHVCDDGGLDAGGAP